MPARIHDALYPLSLPWFVGTNVRDLYILTSRRDWLQGVSDASRFMFVVYFLFFIQVQQLIVNTSGISLLFLFLLCLVLPVPSIDSYGICTMTLLVYFHLQRARHVQQRDLPTPFSHHPGLGERSVWNMLSLC